MSVGPDTNNDTNNVALAAPEILKARWRQFGVPHRVLDIFVPEVILN